MDGLSRVKCKDTKRAGMDNGGEMKEERCKKRQGKSSGNCVAAGGSLKELLQGLVAVGIM